MNQNIQYRTENGSLTCFFSGKLDTVFATGIDREIQTRIAEAGLPVVFDLAGVDYIASAFLRICLRTAKQAQSFSMIHVAPPVKKVFIVAGFDKAMNIS